MKCFRGIEKKLEDNTMFYREPMQIDKDWSNYVQIFMAEILFIIKIIMAKCKLVTCQNARRKFSHESMLGGTNLKVVLK